jgi:hypothetical protein
MEKYEILEDRSQFSTAESLGKLLVNPQRFQSMIEFSLFSTLVSVVVVWIPFNIIL